MSHRESSIARRSVLGKACFGSFVALLAAATMWLPSIAAQAQSADVSVAPSTAPATGPSVPIPANLRELYSRPPAEWPAATWAEGVERRELGLLPKVEHPASNPYTEAKAELGKKLFFDGRLSSSNGVACVSCHHPDLAWGDGKTLALGHHLQSGARNAPSIMNVAYRKSLMWDGRAESLEDQVLLPLADAKEMHADFDKVAERLNAIPSYVAEFKSVFGEDGPITIERVSKAIACFERTVTGGRSRFDKFLAGKYDALSDTELRGLHLFRTTANCINCHNGPTLSDEKFHNIGLTYYKRKYEDLGRYKVTNDPADVGKFLTPPLRNVTRTGPYMHNGLFALEGVLNMYIAGSPKNPPRTDEDRADPKYPKLSPLLHRLQMTMEDRDAVIAFLKSLEEPPLRVRVDLPPDAK